MACGLLNVHSRRPCPVPNESGCVQFRTHLRVRKWIHTQTHKHIGCSSCFISFARPTNDDYETDGDCDRRMKEQLVITIDWKRYMVDAL